MKLEISLNTGEIITLSSPDYQSDHLMVFGIIEKINTGINDNNINNFVVLEKFLNSLHPDDLINKINCIEGNYLIVWKNNNHLYIFSDRYCINPFYYTVYNKNIFIFDSILDEELDLYTNQQSMLKFLLFRFIPGRETLFENIQRIMPGDCIVINYETGSIDIEVGIVYPIKQIGELSETDAENKLGNLFSEALISRISKYNYGEKFLIPISGGFDSRYVLSNSLEIVDSNRIIAMTFGTPGTYDFEIGRTISQVAGVKHIQYPLSYKDFNNNSFIESCKDCDGQISFTTEAPVKIFRDFAQYGQVVLSGYVGDAVMGNKAKNENIDNKMIIALKDAIVDRQHFLVKHLSEQSLDDSFYYDKLDGSSLIGIEKWFFINHFTKYSVYCVFKNREHFQYINPFIDYAFIDFALNLPLKMRKNRSLFFSSFQKKYPKIWSLPCKLYRGLSPTDSSIKKFLNLQLDRVLDKVLKKNKKVNTIDFYRQCNTIINIEELLSNSRQNLNRKFKKILFDKTSKDFFIKYNMKCLSILQNYFGVQIRK